MIRSRLTSLVFQKKKGNRKLQNSDGVVVILVLWVLMILTALAISLGKNAHIEMSLTKNALGKLKSKYIARGGVMYGLNQIALDSEDTASNQEDTLYYCGIRKDDKVDVKELFNDKKLGDGSFTIAYKQKNSLKDKEEIYYGLSDEERRINLNELTPQNVNIFIELLKLLDVEEDVARTIAYSVIDWVDQDGNKSDYRYGAENDYYKDLKDHYLCKNRPLDVMEELLLVRGMTPGIFSKIRPYTTIFPISGNLMINFDTAPEIVLQALARAFSEISRISSEDADGLAEKIVSYRQGQDGKSYTSDDEVFDDTKVSLDSSERTLLQMINQFRTKRSNYFRIQAEGKDANGIKTNIETIVSRESYAILSWHRY